MNISQQLQQIELDALSRIKAASDPLQLEELRIKYLGRKGVLTAVLKEIGKLPKGISFTPWNAAAGVRDPYERVIPKDKESPLNRDFFQNFKAQAWWNVARRFEITYRAITESDYTYDPDDIISISSKLPLLWSLISELIQPVMTRSASTLKLVVKKKPDGAKSPNLGDSFVMNYYPAPAPHKPALALGGIQVLKGRP